MWEDSNGFFTFARVPMRDWPVLVAVIAQFAILKKVGQQFHERFPLPFPTDMAVAASSVVPTIEANSAALVAAEAIKFRVEAALSAVQVAVAGWE